MHKAKFLKSEYTIGKLLKEIETDMIKMDRKLKVLEEEKKRNDEIWKSFDEVIFEKLEVELLEMRKKKYRSREQNLKKREKIKQILVKKLMKEKKRSKKQHVKNRWRSKKIIMEKLMKGKMMKHN